MKLIDKIGLKKMDFVFLIYYIIIFTFNCAFDNMQMMSTILLFLLCVVGICWKHGYIYIKKVNSDDCCLWYGIFFAYMCLSYFWSTPEGISSINVFTSLIQLFVFCICIDWYIQSEDEVEKISKIFCFASFFFGFVVFITSSPSTYNSLEFGKFTGMQRNTTGYVLMYGCLFDIYYGKKLKQKKYYLAAIFCMFVSLLTGSRKIIFGYIIAFALWLVFQKNIKKSIEYMLLAIVGVAIVIPVLYQIPYIQQTFGSRLLAIFDDSIYDGSVLARTRAKQLAIVLFKQSPIWGNGWNAVVSNYASYWGRINSIYAHNNYLEIAADFGIIGIVLFYWKFIKEILWCFKKRKIYEECNFLIICIAIMLVLDYGQVTYCYLYMLSIYVILLKKIYFLKKR